MAYYKLGEYKDPLRIESFFSSMTVLVRGIWENELTRKDEVTIKILKEKIKLVLMSRNPTNFEEAKFYDQWKKSYTDNFRNQLVWMKLIFHEPNSVVKMSLHWTEN